MFLCDARNCDSQLDYSLFIPADAYRPLPVEDSDDDYDDYDRAEDEARAQAEREAAMEALMQKDELEEKFKEHSGGADTMGSGKVADMARGLGFAPSQEDIASLKEKHGDNVSFKDAKEFFVNITHPEDTRDHLMEFFRHYDSQKTGKLSRKQIRNLLTHFGEEMSDKEIDAAFNKCGLNSDPVDYAQFVEQLLAP